MYWFVTTAFIIFSVANLSEANKLEKKLPSAVIVGTVYCDTCFQAELSNPSHFIAGALVGVECKGATSNPSFQKQVKTNAKGEFRVYLPFSVSKHVNKIKNCSVKLIKSNEPYCAIASSATQSSLHLKTKSKKIHIFSAGYFTFKPQNQPNICNQKPSKNFNSRKFLPLINPTPLLQNPTILNLPLTDQIPTIPNLQPTGQNPVIPNLPSTGQNPVIPNLPPTSPSLLPPLPTLPRLPPLPLLPPLPQLPGLPLFPPSASKLKLKYENTLQETKMPNYNKVSKLKNALEKTELPIHDVEKSKNTLRKTQLPNHELRKSKNTLEKTESPDYEEPKTENTLEKSKLPNFEEGEDQILPTTILSSPPPVFGFQFPPFSFRQPPTNFPTNPFQQSPPSVNFPANPFQQSPPSGNFPTIPNLNPPPVLSSPPVLTNPILPPFPFQPSQRVPMSPPATDKQSP